MKAQMAGNRNMVNGLRHKTGILEENLKFFKAELDIYKFKYDQSKKQVKTEKRKRRKEVAALKNQLAVMTQQFNQMAMSSVASRVQAPTFAPVAPFQFLPQMATPAIETNDSDSDASITVPATLANAHKPPKNL